MPGFRLVSETRDPPAGEVRPAPQRGGEVARGHRARREALRSVKFVPKLVLDADNEGTYLLIGASSMTSSRLPGVGGVSLCRPAGQLHGPTSSCTGTRHERWRSCCRGPCPRTREDHHVSASAVRHAVPGVWRTSRSSKCRRRRTIAERKRQKAEQAKNVEACIDAARWALHNGLLPEFREAASAAWRIDKEHPTVKRLAAMNQTDQDAPARFAGAGAGDAPVRARRPQHAFPEAATISCSCTTRRTRRTRYPGRRGPRNAWSCWRPCSAASCSSSAWKDTTWRCPRSG